MCFEWSVNSGDGFMKIYEFWRVISPVKMVHFHHLPIEVSHGTLTHTRNGCISNQNQKGISYNSGVFLCRR